MYKVLADGNVIYDDRVPSSSGLYIVNPKLHLEDSVAGSFEFTLVPGTFAYTAVEPMTTVIKVLRNDVEIFEGRVLTESYDFNNVRSCYCEGELAYLNDTYQPQSVYHDITLRQLIQYILCVHNTKVPPNKRFNWDGVTDPSNPDSLVHLAVEPADPAGDTQFRYTQYESSLAAINKIVETYGGHIVCKKFNDYPGMRCLSIYNDYQGEVNQEVAFGVNLLDYAKDCDYSKICSVVLPTGGVIVSKGEVKKGTEFDLTTSSSDVLLPLTHDYIFLNDEGLWQHCAQGKEYAYTMFYRASVRVEEYKTYYLTCRMRGAHKEEGWDEYKNNYAIYSFRRADGSVLQMKTVSISEQAGFVDTVDLEITAPAGAAWIDICGLDYPELQMKLADAMEPEEDLDEYVTVESVNDGSLYVVNQELVNKYGWIEKQIQWDDITDPQTLYNTASLYLSADQFNETTYELTAVDMSLLGLNCNAMLVGQKISCVSPVHGLDRSIKFPITALDIPLDSPENMTVQLGYAKTPTLTQANNDLSDDILARIAALPSESKTLTSAKQNAAAMINNATSGYVTIHNSGDGTDEIIIADGPDYLTAQNVWRWNAGGLGFSNQGYAPNQFETAITADGAIVANFITAGEMSASRIRGDVLSLGGMDNINGYMEIKAYDPTYQEWYQHVIADNQGVQVLSKEYDLIQDDHVYKSILLQDGCLKAGSWIDGDFTEYGHIAMTFVASTSSGDKYMMDVNSPVLQFNCDELWLTERNGGGATTTYAHQIIPIVTQVSLNADGTVSNVSGTSLEFIHGILVTPYGIQ